MPTGRKYEHSSAPGCGRALRATARIGAGELILRERPAAMVPSTADNVADCNQMLAQIIAAGWQGGTHEQAIGALVHCTETARARDPELLEQLVRTSTAAIASLVAERCGGAAAASVDATAVETAYMQHLCNSMSILDPANSAVEVGMGLYPVDGALMNHSNDPSCWILFEDDATLVVRSLRSIEPREEITFSYVDLEQPYASLRQQLYEQYFFCCGETDDRCGAAVRFDTAAVDRIVRNKRYADHVQDFDNAAQIREGKRLEPGALIRAVRRAHTRAVEANDFDTLMSVSKDCLQLYRSGVYRIVHPRVASAMRAAGLAALKKRCRDVSAARQHLTSAVRIFTVTHGKEHAMTTSTAEMLQLVQRLPDDPSSPCSDLSSTSAQPAPAGCAGGSGTESKQALQSDATVTVATMKNAGNVAYRSKQYGVAVAEYSRAIKLFEEERGRDEGVASFGEAARLFANRAAARIKLGQLYTAEQVGRPSCAAFRVFPLFAPFFTTHVMTLYQVHVCMTLCLLRWPDSCTYAGLRQSPGTGSDL
eukprot:SAG22_NODE_2180_length_2878_cov_1.324217_3_plen_537_part_00